MARGWIAVRAARVAERCTRCARLLAHRTWRGAKGRPRAAFNLLITAFSRLSELITVPREPLLEIRCTLGARSRDYSAGNSPY